MPDDGVEITGLVETQKMIRNLPSEIASGFEQDLMAPAAVVQDALRAGAPRREQRIGGDAEFPPLHETVVTDIHVNLSRFSGVASTGFGESGPVALWNEYGHRVVTHLGVDTGEHTDPDPFMRRVTDNCADRAIDAFSAKVAQRMRSQYGG